MAQTEGRDVKRAAMVIVFAGLMAALGCGPAGPKTYSVSGKVELKGADAKVLAGSVVEASLVSEPTVRANGAIRADGTFTLETLHKGVIYRGAQEGEYQARIILGDDDKEQRRAATKAVSPRYLDFKASGLTFKVPAEGEVKLALSPR